MKRLLVAVLLSALAGVLLSTQAQPRQGNLRMAITQDEGTLTPYTYQTGYPGYELMTLIYDTLLLNNAQLQPQPWLAESVQLASPTSYRVALRQGVVWSDGRPLTSGDVAFTIAYFKANLLGRFTTNARLVTAVETPDQWTVVLQLGRPDPTFVQRALADIPILPRHIWETVGEPKQMQTAMGSGPYRLVEYRPDQFYRLEANPRFWGPRPAFDTVTAVVIKDQTATFQALLTGAVDVAVRVVPPELVEQFSARRDLAVARGPGFATTIMLANVAEGALADARVRQVMAGLINYAQLIDTLLLGFGTAGSPGFLHPANPLFLSAAGEPARLSPAEAQRRLDELGYRAGTDGVRADAQGRRLDFELLAASNNPIRLRAAELIAQDLERGGIRIRVRAIENETLVQRVWPDFDVSKGRNYQLSIFGWSAPVNALARLGDLLHSNPAAGTLNLSGYRSAEADALADRAAVATDTAERARLVGQLQSLLARDLPLITLFYQDGVYAYRPAAFDGWTYMVGQGIINKRSFLAK